MGLFLSLDRIKKPWRIAEIRLFFGTAQKHWQVVYAWTELQLQICPEQNIIISPYPINNRDKNEGLRSSWTNVDPATMLRSLLLTVQRFNDIPQYHKLLKIKTFIALKYSYLYFWHDMECIDIQETSRREYSFQVYFSKLAESSVAI